MKLMILDDDVQIREGIQFGIDWKSLGISEVKSFGDAVSALEELEEFGPQIILADIRMPEMDGLEFLRRVKTKRGSVKVILISAYSDFEYCQRAIQYGAAGYELKPLKVGRLIQTIQETVNQIREEEVGRENYRKYVDTYREKVVEELFDGRITDRNVLMEILSMHFGIREARTLLCMAVLPDYGGNLTVEQSFWQDRLEKDEHVFCFRGGLAVLTKTADSTLFILEKQNRLKSLFRAVRRHFLDRGVSVSGGISGMFAVEEIHRGYLMADHALLGRFYAGEGYVGIYGIDTAKQVQFPYREREMMIRESTVSLDPDKISDAIQRIKRELRECGVTDARAVRQLVLYGLEALYGAAGRGEKLKLLEWNGEMERMTFLSEYMEYWEKKCREFLDDYEREQSRRYSANVKRALSYIEEHYGEDIGVEQVSGYIGKTPNYFSSIFKQEMGISFREYLNQYRIQKAQELILHSDLMIYEISEKVGYRDYAYFSQVFKKLAGCSPTGLRSGDGGQPS